MNDPEVELSGSPKPGGLSVYFLHIDQGEGLRHIEIRQIAERRSRIAFVIDCSTLGKQYKF
jgi:hypothetical protein